MNYDKLLQDVISEARKINIPISNNINPNVLINSRAKGRFGRCRKRADVFIIEISVYLQQAEESAIKQTLAHEILHTCPNCMNHGQVWKMYARKMNRVYGYDISRTSTCDNLGIEALPKKRNYIMKCKKCGKEFIRERMSNAIKNIENYRCKCGGNLTLI